MKVSFTTSGSTDKTERFLKRLSQQDMFKGLDGIARAGVNALSAATPVESGATAAAWGYDIKVSRNGASIIWTNSHSVSGVNIAVILQYGHGTGTGGYVTGRDYINPAMRPIFDQLADKAWKVVTSA